MPTGSIAWFASTILHPALLFGAAIPLAFVSPIMGTYLGWAAFAIFVKARIQKALIVETVYDLFDARIEHEFTQSLSNPQQLKRVERTGFIVPGLARTLGEGLSVDGAGTLAPELASLMSDRLPRVEVRPSANGSAGGDGDHPVFSSVSRE